LIAVGSVEVSFPATTTSAFVAEWRPPYWDTEGLTTGYNLTCYNNSVTLNTTIIKKTNVSSDYFEQTFDRRGYECCLAVMTEYGSGPASCFQVPGSLFCKKKKKKKQNKKTNYERTCMHFLTNHGVSLHGTHACMKPLLGLCTYSSRT